MLCMGAINPQGISECTSVIENIIQELKTTNKLPPCQLPNGLDSKTQGSYVTSRKASYTPPCPEGTTQGQDGIIYHFGAMPSIRKDSQSSNVEGFQNQRILEDNFVFYKVGDYSQRVCISGKLLSSIPSSTSRIGSKTIKKLPEQWVEHLQIMKPDGASYQFDLFIDNQIYSSHRF